MFGIRRNARVARAGACYQQSAASGRWPMLGPVEEPERAAPGEPPPPRRLAWSTAIFAAATGLSRVLGLVREIVARDYFGVEGAGINSFTVAFQIPNLVRALVADAA